MVCLVTVLTWVKQWEMEIISASEHIKAPIMGTESNMAALPTA